MRKITFSLFLLLFLFLLSPVSLAVPHEINYQGILKHSSGNLASGEVNMTFAIYSHPTNGTLTDSLWNETQNNVTVEAGLYSVQLGSQTAITPEVFNGDTRYLEVIVGSETLSPRIPLISVPYAFRAEVTETFSPAALPDPIVPADSVQNITGSLEVSGSIAAGGAVVDPKKALRAANTIDPNVYGEMGENKTYVMPMVNSKIGVYGQANTDTRGMLGYLRAPVYGGTTKECGVYGVSFSTSGEKYGVHGETASETGRGVYGWATNTSGLNYGVYGESASEGGVGVYGYANSTSGPTVGTYGRVESPQGFAGYFTGGKGVYIDDILFLAQRVNAPSPAQVGMIYFSTAGKVRVCTQVDPTVWEDLN